MHHRKRLLTGAAVLATAALALTGCTPPGSGDTDKGDGALTPVTLQLQWFAQAQFSGYYAALDQGFYKDEGLDVTLKEGGADIVPQDALTSGEADYAISWVPKVLGSIEQGAHITNVAQIFERSATTQISFKDKNINSIEDLKGHTVGSWGYGNEWEIFAGLQKAGLSVDDITLVTQAFDMLGMLQGDIDAAQAMTYNEYAQVLESVNPATGKLYQPDEINVIDYNKVGVGMLQDSIWADADRLASDPKYEETTVKFLKASIKGWIFAMNDPQKAADIVTAAGSTLGTSHQLWMANEVNKLIWPSTNGIGFIDEAAWNRTVGIAKTTKNETGATILTKDPPADAHTNKYIQQALDELKAEGVDVMGANYQPITVTLKEGGK
ncbi:NitT/TauT family transport system substrate-binding protein [Cryobacterium mesophilum]|uniref:Thiamine pyrimidine synthase n=1 Tax=Terrimesophilobacter mesophilus TaxID=433647 RepID=A0A4R8V885_9MICO|nr:ABC transporter substrate-binding protein [Terrimesophilobacter mesophilus]MBB5632526.1 NitT/TauT family transport system substrate-binding protein [Terrimesophilobacter mesophilus]TFB79351.1 ABC transporter substrate-binding protein [Terrimesophilobacter mesophilus]